MLNLGATAQGVQKIYIVGNNNNLKFRNENLTARISIKNFRGWCKKSQKYLNLNNLSTQRDER